MALIKTRVSSRTMAIIKRRAGDCTRLLETATSCSDGYSNWRTTGQLDAERCHRFWCSLIRGSGVTLLSWVSLSREPLTFVHQRILWPSGKAWAANAFRTTGQDSRFLTYLFS